MKKILSLFLLIVCLSGCGTPQPQNTTKIIASKSQLVNNGFIELTKESKFPDNGMNKIYNILLGNKTTKSLDYISDGNSYLIGCQDDVIVLAINLLDLNLDIKDNTVSGNGVIYLFNNLGETPKWGVIELNEKVGLKGNSFIIYEELNEDEKIYKYVNDVNGKVSDLDLSKQSITNAPLLITPDLDTFIHTYLNKVVGGDNNES